VTILTVLRFPWHNVYVCSLFCTIVSYCMFSVFLLQAPIVLFVGCFNASCAYVFQMFLDPLHKVSCSIFWLNLVAKCYSIHIISAYFLAAVSDKRMRLLTSLYGIELACLKKEEKHFACFASSWFGTFAMLSCATGSLAGHENTRRRMVHCYKHLYVSLSSLRFGEIFL